MMILDDILSVFPKDVKLRDGTACVLRPVNRRDDIRLRKFFLGVPGEERLFVKQPITDQTLFRQWCRQPDFERNLPLLLLHGRQIIGEATLHQRGGGWKRHIGLITLLTHPEYRGRDVSKILVSELIEIARGCGPGPTAVGSPAASSCILRSARHPQSITGQINHWRSK